MLVILEIWDKFIIILTSQYSRAGNKYRSFKISRWVSRWSWENKKAFSVTKTIQKYLKKDFELLEPLWLTTAAKNISGFVETNSKLILLSFFCNFEYKAIPFSKLSDKSLMWLKLHFKSIEKKIHWSIFSLTVEIFTSWDKRFFNTNCII